MKTLHLVTISIVFAIMTLTVNLSAFATCVTINGTQECVGSPPVLTSIKSDRLVYENSDKPIITITGVPYSTVNFEIDNQSGDMVFSHLIEVMPTGLTNYALDISSYKSGLYTALASTSANKVTSIFRIGLNLLGPIITLKTMNDTYVPGDLVTILGSDGPNDAIHLSLIDPNGNVVNSVQANSDSTGQFLSNDLKIPLNAIAGVWVINATHGVAQVIKKITVNSSQITALEIESPLQQFKSGIQAQAVQCKTGDELILKSQDGSPACVKPMTAKILIDRDWGRCPLGFVNCP